MHQANTPDPTELPVIIQPARFQDIRMVGTIQREAFRPGLAYSRFALVVLWALPIATFLVARDAGTGDVVGNIICDLHQGNVRVVNVAVAKRVRRGGIGSQLLREVDQRFPDGDIVLAVEQENLAAQRLYEHEGFLRIAITRDYYGINHHGYTMKKIRRNRPASITSP